MGRLFSSPLTKKNHYHHHRHRGSHNNARPTTPATTTALTALDPSSTSAGAAAIVSPVSSPSSTSKRSKNRNLILLPEEGEEQDTAKLHQALKLAHERIRQLELQEEEEPLSSSQSQSNPTTPKQHSHRDEDEGRLRMMRKYPTDKKQNKKESKEKRNNTSSSNQKKKMASMQKEEKQRENDIDMLMTMTEHSLQTPLFRPPSEVLLIRDDDNDDKKEEELTNNHVTSSTNHNSTAALLEHKMLVRLQNKVQDANLRASAYRAKLEAAEDLIANLVRDVEQARMNLHSLAARNMVLTDRIHSFQRQQDEHFISKVFLAKSLFMISPVFILSGTLVVFLGTVALLWLVLELEGSSSSSSESSSSMDGDPVEAVDDEVAVEGGTSDVHVVDDGSNREDDAADGDNKQKTKNY